MASTKYASEKWVWCAQKNTCGRWWYNEGKPPSFLRASAIWRLAIPALMASLAALSETFPAHNAIVPVYSGHVGPAPLALIPLLTNSSTYWWALEEEFLPHCHFLNMKVLQGRSLSDIARICTGSCKSSLASSVAAGDHPAAPNS